MTSFASLRKVTFPSLKNEVQPIFSPLDPLQTEQRKVRKIIFPENTFLPTKHTLNVFCLRYMIDNCSAVDHIEAPSWLVNLFLHPIYITETAKILRMLLF